ncbi:MAG: succinate dehydrogenase assembly factor 2 [Pseudomonadota bacterium]
MIADDPRLRRLKFRASHRGTKEADIMLGGYVEARADSLTEDDITWLEALMMQQDVDIMAWITGKQPPPPAFDTAMMKDMQKLDYIQDTMKLGW